MPTEFERVVDEDARFGAAFLRRHGGLLAIIFCGVLLPLAGFGVLAHQLGEGGGIFFDVPLLQHAHALQGTGFDRFFVMLSALCPYGVVPVDVALIAMLAWRRRVLEGLFAGIAIIGSALLNLGAKVVFARERPGLWESIAPESNFSFPSGHAMGSMTLACVLVLLCWPTRARWPALVAAAFFVALVGVSRVCLGVHYPSDIAAGWMAALAWTIAVHAVVFRGLHPLRSERRRRAIPRAARRL